MAQDLAFEWWPSLEMREAAVMTAFLRAMAVPDIATLNARGAADPAWLWDGLIRFLAIRFATPYESVLDLAEGPAWPRWGVGGRTNLVLTCLDAQLAAGRGDRPAVVWEGEDGARRAWSYAALAAEVDRAAAGLARLGIGPGDGVGLHLPMIPEAVAAFLAVAKIGAVALPLFSGFGPQPIAARLADGAAVAIVTADGTPRRGRPVAMKPVVDEAVAGLTHLRHVIVVERLGLAVAMRPGRDVRWADLAEPGAAAPTAALDPMAPLMVAYTSGTTGRPKGTVHGHLGFLAKTGQDWLIGFDLKPGDRMLWMTDIGWLVGPIQFVAATMAGATLVLAEGAPDHPEPDRLWRLVDRHRVSFLGIGPTLARAMRRHGEAPGAAHDLSAIRVAASTGEPWDAETWRWVLARVLGEGRAPLQNYSGGTEVGGILQTSLLHPMKPGGFHGPIAGTGADIVGETGAPVAAGEVGELVMREPSIGRTIGLWRDPGRYLESYWSRFPGLWVHGDWASRDGDGVWFIHGRSDDTIKVAGKRTGPAEIEAALLATGLVVEAAAVGVPDPVKGQAVACVVVPAAAAPAGPALAEALARAVADGFGGAFRPSVVHAVPDLPKTRNMKVMRRVVRAALTGRPAGDLSVLVNPEAVAALRRAAGAAESDGPGQA